MAKLWKFSEDHTKAAFPEKVQTGDQGKFFKNRPKDALPEKALKHTGANGIIL